VPGKRDVLLIEPNYKNKYPPLGLMKLSAFHKDKNDNVAFFKGDKKDYEQNDQLKDKMWDIIYISTVFTFQYRKTTHSIKLAEKIINKSGTSYLGGLAATLLEDKYSQFDIKIVKGLLNKQGKLGFRGDAYIDKRIPDYSILEEIDYEYPTQDAYIGYATRGCVNNCEFCAVPILEPKYTEYINLKKMVNGIERRFGEKKDLLLMDNNVLASDRFDDIIADIIDLDFHEGATDSHGRKRYVDFNQGLDMRELEKKEARLLSKVAIKPARVAFDHVQMADLYTKKIRLLSHFGIDQLSNFLLYNFKDRPEDLLKRIMINIDLNEELDTKIFSFPMKFIPLDATNRYHIGPHWTKKQLRAIQVILNATHGVVGPKRPFIQRAFCNIPKGRSENEDISYEELRRNYLTLLWMPEKYIMYRELHEKDEAQQWWDQFTNLSKQDRKILKDIIKDNVIDVPLVHLKANTAVKKVLRHYEMLQKRAQSNFKNFSL
jgi:hypothetical protein